MDKTTWKDRGLHRFRAGRWEPTAGQLAAADTRALVDSWRLSWMRRPVAYQIWYEVRFFAPESREQRGVSGGCGNKHYGRGQSQHMPL